MDTFFETHTAKKLLSVLIGFGIATIIRPMCKSEYCTINKASDIDPKTIYKNNEKCMTFDTTVSRCTDAVTTIDNKFTPISNFKIMTTDKIFICSILGALFILSRIFGLSFGLSGGVFIVSVYVNMYLGPIQKTVNIHPTPFNLNKTYKKNDVCFKYTSKNIECTPKAQSIPLQL